MTRDDEAAWREHYAAAAGRGICPHSGESIRACQDIDMCDCFDFPGGTWDGVIR